MKFRTDGLIIREQNIGENDRLVWVLTRTHGVIKAFARGAKKLTFGAQCTAIPFYEKCGCRCVSEIFLDAGLPHRTMEKELN